MGAQLSGFELHGCIEKRVPANLTDGYNTKEMSNDCVEKESEYVTISVTVRRLFRQMPASTRLRMIKRYLRGEFCETAANY